MSVAHAPYYHGTLSVHAKVGFLSLVGRHRRLEIYITRPSERVSVLRSSPPIKSVDFYVRAEASVKPNRPVSLESKEVSISGYHRILVPGPGPVQFGRCSKPGTDHRHRCSLASTGSIAVPNLIHNL